MRHETVNNIDNSDNNAFDILSEPPKDLAQGSELSENEMKALISSLETKLENRDIYENVLPSEYFDEIEDTLASLKEQSREIEK